MSSNQQRALEALYPPDGFQARYSAEARERIARIATALDEAEARGYAKAAADAARLCARAGGCL